MMNSPAISLRVRLGVTGHRVLKDPELIAQKIRDFLTSGIYELFDTDMSQEKGMKRIAFTILTPLAEGADRLVAWEVLKIPDSEIEVVLPFEKEEYLKDFATEQSRQEFEELYRKAANPIELKGHLFTKKLSTTDRAKMRNRAYEDVGRYVVNRCDVLIALWDGKPSRGKGGTAEIVAFAREKKRSLIIIISPENPENIVIEKDLLPLQSGGGENVEFRF